MDQSLPPQRRQFMRRIVIDLAVMVAIGAFLGVLGPFGSIDAPLPVRIVSWVGFALLGYVFYRPMDPLATWAHRTLDLPRWALLIGTCLIATFPMSFAIIAIVSLPDAPSWPGLESAMATYLSVLVIGGAVTAFFNLARPGERDAAAVPPPMAAPGPMPAPMLSPVFAPATAPAPAPAPSPPPAPNPLFDQLPPELGSDIIALEMEDHYVRVHTALGSALVLMRLRDGIALVGDLEGMQVHRSWWVARGAVEDIIREGRNVRLKLARGIEAPVARAKLAELKDARWI
ncbi:LytTR family transcriptional regulator DNA-binding domain-containing protein [Erythrobacter sp. NFXS35]